MEIKQRSYPGPGFHDDYARVRSFIRGLDKPSFHYGRWDWMVTHGYLDIPALTRIGLWEERGTLVGVAAFDTQPGDTFLLADAAHAHLYPGMLHYAREHLSVNGVLRVVIPDENAALQTCAANAGLKPTQDRECDAIFRHTDPLALAYTLPEGFTAVSMADRPDYFQYGLALWRGFNHKEEGPFEWNEAIEAGYRASFERPNVNMNLKIAVAAPSGDFASYCGMWYESGTRAALVEPVVTAPAYRKMGLERAAVLEGVRRCMLMGAEVAYVGSSQQFYYQIGFAPCGTSTVWAEPAQ